MTHTPVLLHESIEGLSIRPGDTYVDGTLGAGGHMEEVCKRFGDAVVMIGIDMDSDALLRSKARLDKLNPNIIYVRDSFRHIDCVLDEVGVGTADRILLDIGLSSDQFEDSKRGFSFQKDEPLLMSFKKELSESDLSAREIVNDWDVENLEAVIRGYGEERFAGRIARAIGRVRQVKPIETTGELVDIILSATPSFYHRQKIHPATRTFQALRITVNDEIESLKEGIRKGFERLNRGGRLAVISFHSLEDREVKRFFKEMLDQGKATPITKKPVIPSEREKKANPRSRSAKLRVIEKI